MVYKTIYTSWICVAVVFGWQCQKPADPPSQDELTGQLVIFDPCGNAAIEVLGGTIDPSKLVSTWTDPDNGTVYHNIFAVGAVQNGCTLAVYGLSQGDVFKFQLDANPKEIICNSCNDTNPVSVPPIRNAVKNITK